jgi:DNA-binding transcriptional LysR family regulator
MSREPRGMVRLTAPPDIELIGLPAMLTRFRAEHPLVRFDLELTSRHVDLVEEGFDLAIRAGRIDDSSLVVRKIVSSEMGLFASPAYLQAKGRPASIDAVSEHDAVVLRPRAGAPLWRLTGPRREVVVRPRAVVLADHLGFVYGALLAGAGIGLLPVEQVAKDSGLERILPGFTIGGGGLYVVWPSRAFVPARVTLFREFLIRELEAGVRRCQSSRRQAGRVASDASD